MQSISLVRLSARSAEKGRVRFTFEETIAARAHHEADEGELLVGIAKATRSWASPTLLTLGGKRVGLHVLRWRSLALKVKLPLVRTRLGADDAAGWLCQDGVVPHIDLLADLGLSCLTPRMPIAAFCDAIGLRFTACFHDYRHEPLAIAEILAFATAAVLAVRARHDDVASSSASVELLAELAAQSELRRISSPWLFSLLHPLLAGDQ